MTHSGVGYWMDRISADAKAELEEIKRQYRSGAIKARRRTLARAISRHLRERGICSIGHYGVEAWLQKG
jgi:hypothetical protein